MEASLKLKVLLKEFPLSGENVIADGGRPHHVRLKSLPDSISLLTDLLTLRFFHHSDSKCLCFYMKLKV